MTLTVAAHAERPPVLRARGGSATPADACLTVAGLVEAVNLTLGRVGLLGPDEAGRAPIDETLSIEFAHADNGARWTAGSDRDNRGATADRRTREISRVTNDCRALDSALVLVASLLVDAQRAIDPAPIKVDAGPAAALARPVPTRRHAPTFETGLRVTIAAGPMPRRPGPDGVGPLRGEPVARRRARRHVVRAHERGRSARRALRRRMVLGRLLPDARERGTRALVGCARAGLGVSGGVGTAVDIPQRATVAYGLAGLAARMRVSLVGPLGVSVEVAGYVPFGAPRFVVRSGAADVAVFTASPVYGALTACLEMRAF